MLGYYRIDISEGIDVNESKDESKECHISHYWLFLNKYFNFQPCINNNGFDYRCNFTRISKSKVESLLQNVDLSEKSTTFIKHKNLFSHIKWAKKL